MSIAFAVNHAAVTTPILYASSVLTSTAGLSGNAVLYGATLVVSLLFANPLFSLLGSNIGLSVSMVCYAAYVFLFSVAAAACVQTDAHGVCTEGSLVQFPAAIVGATIGGCGAGLLWTCQGAIFASSAQRLAEAEHKGMGATTAELAKTFGAIFLGFEAGVRLLTTVLREYAKLSYSDIFYMYSSLALLSALAFMATATNLQSGAAVLNAELFSKILAAGKLWRDPKFWLLQFTNITFGLAAAWLAGYVGENILSKAVSSGVIGFASALTSALAAVLCQVLGTVSQTTGKGPILMLGAVCFALLGALSKVGDPTEWGWGALVFYACMGVGRAVYESTNRAIFAEYFPGPDRSPGVFANVMVFTTGATSVAFVLDATGRAGVELHLLLLCAALTSPGFLLAAVLARRGEAQELLAADGIPP